VTHVAQREERAADEVGTDAPQKLERRTVRRGARARQVDTDGDDRRVLERDPVDVTVALVANPVGGVDEVLAYGRYLRPCLRSGRRTTPTSSAAALP